MTPKLVNYTHSKVHLMTKWVELVMNEERSV